MLRDRESINLSRQPLVGLTRFNRIVLILVKYGFRDFVDRYNLPDLGLAGRITGIERGLTVHERIRLVLQELGTTFIKFGQVASMRPDLVPGELIVELEKLQDSVPPEPPGDVTKRLVADLGPLHVVFSEFDEKPFAAASLSDVHRAVLRETGETVAVKVRRPKAYSTVQADLRVLSYLANTLHNRYPDMRPYNLPSLVEELRRTINNELNFLKEAANIKIFRAAMEKNGLVTAPKVYDAYTTRKVLTTELIEGVKVGDFTGDLVQRRKLAEAGFNTQVRQILLDGFFHADPHAGNVLITPSGQLCLLDWGMVGRLTFSMRQNIVDLLQAIIQRDEEHLAAIALHSFGVHGDANTPLLQRDIRELLDSFFAANLRHRNAGRLLLDFLTIFQRHHIPIPAQYAFMSKAFLTMEGLGQQIYPNLDTVALLKPYLRELTIERGRPSEAARKLKIEWSNTVRLFENFPQRLDRIIDHMEKGEVFVKFEGTDRLEKSLAKSANRLTMGVVLGSMILGSSVLISAGIPPLIHGHSGLGLAGFAISAFVSLCLLLDIWRERRR